jgi:hypothetical protein
MEAGKVAAQSRRPIFGDECDCRGKGDPGLKGVAKLSERRGPRALALTLAASAPSRRPRHWCVGARDRAGQREYRDVHERPHEDGSNRSRGEDGHEKEGQAERQLALMHKTAEAPDSELDLDAANNTGPDESDPGGKYEPQQEAGHRDDPETRKPRASLTG